MSPYFFSRWSRFEPSRHPSSIYALDTDRKLTVPVDMMFSGNDQGLTTLPDAREELAAFIFSQNRVQQGVFGDLSDSVQYFTTVSMRGSDKGMTQVIVNTWGF
jgi:hypothetical protein